MGCMPKLWAVLLEKANKGLLDKLEELVKETNEQVDVVKKESEAKS